MLPISCLVHSCNRRGGFRVPQMKELRLKWLAAIKWAILPLEPKSTAIICPSHFIAEDFIETEGKGITKKILKPDAVPSVFPWNSDLWSKKRKNIPSSSSSNASESEELEDDFGCPTDSASCNNNNKSKTKAHDERENASNIAPHKNDDEGCMEPTDKLAVPGVITQSESDPGGTAKRTILSNCPTGLPDSSTLDETSAPVNIDSQSSSISQDGDGDESWNRISWSQLSQISKLKTLEVTRKDKILVKYRTLIPPSKKQKRKKSGYRKKTEDQIRLLELTYEKNKFPNGSDRYSLSQKTGLDAKAILVWFQNRRGKERRSMREGLKIRLSLCRRLAKRSTTNQVNEMEQIEENRDPSISSHIVPISEDEDEPCEISAINDEHSELSAEMDTNQLECEMPLRNDDPTELIPETDQQECEIPLRLDDADSSDDCEIVEIAPPLVEISSDESDDDEIDHMTEGRNAVCALTSTGDRSNLGSTARMIFKKGTFRNLVPEEYENSNISLIIDGQPGFKSHFSRLKEKLECIIDKTITVHAHLTTSDLMTTYNRYFGNEIARGIIYWGNTEGVHPIFTLQKRFVALVAHSSQPLASRLNFQTLKILTLPSVYILHCLIHVHRNAESIRYQVARQPNKTPVYERQGLEFYDALPSTVTKLYMNQFIAEVKMFLKNRALFNAFEYYDSVRRFQLILN